MTFDFVDFGGSIVGGIISSFIFILIWEWWKRPNLRLEYLPTDPAINQAGVGFYHIKVINEGRSTAENCHLVIKYKNHILDPLITLDPGKWDKNPEPVAYDPNYGRIADPSLLYHIGEISIGPKGIATFCFLIKYAGEEPCYGFNAENYFHPGFRVNDNRRMGIGEYMVTTTVKGDNAENEATFLLRNNGPHHTDVTLLTFLQKIRRRLVLCISNLMTITKRQF